MGMGRARVACYPCTRGQAGVIRAHASGRNSSNRIAATCSTPGLVGCRLRIACNSARVLQGHIALVSRHSQPYPIFDINNELESHDRWTSLGATMQLPPLHRMLLMPCHSQEGQAEGQRDAEASHRLMVAYLRMECMCSIPALCCPTATDSTNRSHISHATPRSNRGRR